MLKLKKPAFRKPSRSSRRHRKEKPAPLTVPVVFTKRDMKKIQKAAAEIDAINAQIDARLAS